MTTLDYTLLENVQKSGFPDTSGILRSVQGIPQAIVFIRIAGLRNRQYIREYDQPDGIHYEITGEGMNALVRFWKLTSFGAAIGCSEFASAPTESLPPAGNGASTLAREAPQVTQLFETLKQNGPMKGVMPTATGRTDAIPATANRASVGTVGAGPGSTIADLERLAGNVRSIASFGTCPNLPDCVGGEGEGRIHDCEECPFRGCQECMELHAETPHTSDSETAREMYADRGIK